MSIADMQEQFSRFYRYASYCASNEDFDTARRALVCAAALLSKISSNCNEKMQEIYEKKYIKLVERTISTKDEYLDELIKDLSKKYLGCEMDPIINTAIVENEIKDVTFDSVAGLEDVKLLVNRQIINPIKYAKIYKRYQKQKCGGFLLYGLPGTGKTMIAKAIANEIDAYFLPVKCSDILSKWLGESEQRINDLFEEAKSHKLSIIFFDEFEALGQSRDNDDASSHIGRVVTELLTHIQGFNNRGNVFIIGATNRPWDVDSAFLRPGRLDKQIYVPLPDESARLTIISKIFRGIPISSDISFENIAKATEGYSGADVTEVCETAKCYAIEREIATKSKSEVQNGDIAKALSEVHSSIRKYEAEEMEKYLEAVGA